MKKKINAYVASAGSGKTFALVKDYLKLLLTCPNKFNFDKYYFQNILAITFTNNAASEMRNRIQKELSEIAKGTMTSMLEVIIKEIYEQTPKNLIAQKEIQQRAQQIKRAIWYRYSDFAVRTIDSFQQSVGMAFQKELYLPPQTELDLTTKIKQEVLEEFLNRMGSHKHKLLTKFTIELIYRKLDNQKSTDLASHIEKYITEVYEEFPISLLNRGKAKNMAQWQSLQNQLYKYIDNVANAVKAPAQIAQDAINQAGLTKKDFFQKANGIGNFFEKYINASTFVFETPNKYHEQAIQEGKWTAGSASSQVQESVNSISELLKQCFFNIEKVRQEHQTQVSLCRELLANFYQMTVCSSIIEILTEVKTKRRFSDLLEISYKINEVILKDPVPYIYEKIGERYHHILVDEFQDTSQVQWSNLIPLISNSISKNLFCTLVGDTKQSIYRWRGTDVKNLAYLPSIAHMNSPMLETHQPIIQKQFKKNILDTNYRSSSAVIDFNNSLFSYLIGATYSKFPLIKNCYESIEQKVADKKLQGNVSILSLSEEAGIYYLDFVKQQINYFLQKGFRKSDIAILCRTNNNISDASIFLSNEGIAWQCEKSTHYLKDSAWIQSIIYLLDLQKNYTTDHTLFPECLLHFAQCLGKEIKNSDLFGWLEELKTQEHDRQYLTVLLHRIFKTQFALDIDFEYLKTLSVFAFVKEICFVLQPYSAPSESPYFEGFQEYVWNFCTKEGNDLSGFLDFWKSENPTIPQSAFQDALHLITIHNSKGLEFPVVILPLLKIGGSKNTDPIWQSWNKEWLNVNLDFAILKPKADWLGSPFESVYKDYIENIILENLNLLYVALTRAKQHLTVLADSTVESSKSKEETKNYLNSFLFDFLNHNTSYFRCVKDMKVKTVKEDEDMVLEYKIYSTGAWERDLEFTHAPAAQGSVFEKTPTERSPYLWQDKGFLQANFWESSRAQVFQEKSRLGVGLHNLLGCIDDETDVTKALHLGVENCWIEPSKRLFFKELIEKVISEPSVRHAFKKSKDQICYKERSLLTETSQLIRPDRFVYHPAYLQLTLIDYKTGMRKTQDQWQLKKYETVLKGIFPEARFILKYLIYISLDSSSVEVVQV